MKRLGHIPAQGGGCVRGCPACAAAATPASSSFPAKKEEVPLPAELTQTALRGRGWTPAMLKRFAPEPRIKRRRFGGHLCLYPRDQVLAIEESEDWKAAAAVGAKRSAAGRATAARAAAELVETVQELKLRLVVPAGALDKAIDSYNFRQFERMRWDDGRPGASRSSSPHFLRRIVGNYLRHECSNYDHVCRAIRARPGTAKAYETLRQRIDAEVEAAVERVLSEGKPSSPATPVATPDKKREAGR
jgi:hypothetical protein